MKTRFLFHKVIICLVGVLLIGTLVSCGDKEQTEKVARSSYEWNGWLFSGSTEQYNANLAVVAAKLCQDVYSKEGILSQLDAYGFDGCEGYNYSASDSLGRFVGTNCFVIGHDELNINGKETTLLCVIVRGTYASLTNPGEAIGDVFKGGIDIDPILQAPIWNHVYDFYKDLDFGIKEYVKTHPVVKRSDNLKLLITGHSLGGGAANVLGAAITKAANKLDIFKAEVSTNDIFVYTFGGVPSIAGIENKNIEDGYENIHNIYNYYDSFGPNGNWVVTATMPFCKFGHTEMYMEDALHDKEDGLSFHNHDMDNYIRAVEKEKEKRGSTLQLKCVQQDVSLQKSTTSAMTVAPTTQPPSTAATTNQSSSPSVPDGTYVCYSLGFIRNTFTFYGDHQIVMNALGISGSGTYVIEKGKIIITYTTNLSSGTSICRLEQSFRIEGDRLFIANEEFIKE